MEVQEIIKATNAYYCLDCGKCSTVCPVSVLNEEYTPRLMVKKAIVGNAEELARDELLWSCLTCKMCNERCESNVEYAEFIRNIRAEAYKVGEEGICSHTGAFQSLMRIMSTPAIKQNRLDWVPKGLKISTESGDSDIIYFVGCLPYFDTFLSDLNLNTIEIAKDSIKIFNYLNIKPLLLPNERCCGHDLLWNGDIEGFKKLATQNIGEIKKTGGKRIIFSCPECYYTFKDEYPKYIKMPGGIEILHIYQFIIQNLHEFHFLNKNSAQKVTYQDPCRLGRFCEIYEEPRQIMDAMGVELIEMPKHKKSAICCGTSGWVNCSSFSKQLQVNRLKEAKSTGAKSLITGCPKCQIHFKCTMNDKNVEKDTYIKIQDLVSLIASNLKK